MRIQHSLAHLADSTVVRELRARATFDRTNTAEWLVYIAEFDSRKLYLPAGYSSTYAYCVGELRLSEDAAYKRIQAARAARRFPALFELLAIGELHLAAIVLLAPHLVESNARELVAAAKRKSKAQIEELLAARFPRPELPAQVRALPAAPLHPNSQLAPGQVESCKALPERALEFASEPIQAPAPGPDRATAPDGASPAPPIEARARTMPVSADRFGLQLTMDREAHDMLRYVQNLLGHEPQSRDLAQIWKRALAALIREVEKKKFAASAQPRTPRRSRPGERNPRTIPAQVKRAVWQRDRGQCTFVSASGHRCDSRRQLEFDHIEPIGRGGVSSVSNLRLRCRAHNQYEAGLVFGAGFMESKRDRARGIAAVPST